MTRTNRLRSPGLDVGEEDRPLGLAFRSFADDWDNDLDAVYDDWKALYGVA